MNEDLHHNFLRPSTMFGVLMHFALAFHFCRLLKYVEFKRFCTFYL